MMALCRVTCEDWLNDKLVGWCLERDHINGERIGWFVREDIGHDESIVHQTGPTPDHAIVNALVAEAKPVETTQPPAVY